MKSKVHKWKNIGFPIEC